MEMFETVMRKYFHCMPYIEWISNALCDKFALKQKNYLRYMGGQLQI